MRKLLEAFDKRLENIWFFIGTQFLSFIFIGLVIGGVQYLGVWLGLPPGMSLTVFVALILVAFSIYLFVRVKRKSL